MDKILCLGKNFPNHAEELGEKQPELPVVFAKFPSCLLKCENNSVQPLLLCSKLQTDVHYETEVILELGRDLWQAGPEDCASAIRAVSVGLDLTDRTRQQQAKRAGHPWTLSKNFQNAAVCGPMISLENFKNFMSDPFFLAIDGELKQKGTLKQALHPPNQALSWLSQHIPLCEGDLIYMGTPPGVGPLKPGQQLQITFGEISYKLIIQVEQNGPSPLRNSK